MSTFTCDGCGACCRMFPIFASVEDAVREPRVAAEGKELAPHLRTSAYAFQLYPLPFHESCCFLDADQRCVIYATRPDICRQFAAGGEQCQEARRRSGLPELRSTSREV